MLQHVLHDFSDSDAQRILSQIAAAMRKGYSKLLIKDMVIPDRGAYWLMTTMDVEIMQSLAGMQRTDSQWRALLATVGLEVVGIFTHPSAHDSVIEAMLA